MEHDQKPERLHTRREFSKLLLAGAVGGLMAGATFGARRRPAYAQESGDKMPPHACKGMNDCKGQGGCATANNDCTGQNECKGQGGCATVQHDCKGMNDCKGMGGCKTADHDCRGQNECKGQGGCAVPPKDE